jgi:hypothetical protein
MTAPIRRVSVPCRYLTAALAVLLAGCVSYQLPPEPTREQLEAVTNVHIGGTVGVEPYAIPYYSNALKAALIESRLFDFVDDAERVSNPTLMARIERIPDEPPHYVPTVSNAWEQLPAVLTIVTLGLIPSFGTTEDGYNFSLRRPGDSGPAVVVESLYRGRGVVGWIALFVTLSPDYVGVAPGYPENSHRFRLFVRRLTAEKATELRPAESR